MEEAINGVERYLVDVPGGGGDVLVDSTPIADETRRFDVPHRAAGKTIVDHSGAPRSVLGAFGTFDVHVAMVAHLGAHVSPAAPAVLHAAVLHEVGARCSSYVSGSDLHKIP